MSGSRSTSARAIAARVLARVLEDDAFAAAALSSELAGAPRLDPRDAALATELTYGVLRTEGALFQLLRRRGKIKRSDTQLVVQLYLATYQLAFLDRIPARAAVDEAVGAARRLRGARVAGFVNALLRRTAEDLAERPLALQDAVRDSFPTWLVDELRQAVGLEDADQLLGATGSAPASSLRAFGTFEPSWGDEVRASERVPRGYRFQGRGDPRRRPEFKQGHFSVQEEGAQLVAWALGARAGETVLDACAGRGHKTATLTERVGPAGRVVAAELHEHKLRELGEEFERLGLPLPSLVPLDWTARGHLGERSAEWSLGEGIERVLVDAPCTGVGTLRRRPEIARRLSPDDVTRLAALQEDILRGVAEAVRPGTRVVYATCSVLPAECEAVVERVSELFELVPFDAPEVEATFAPDVSSQRLLPRSHGTDGYFVASLRRR